LKDFDSLINALSNLAATGRVAHAIFAGQGPERAKLQELASAKGVDERVHFIGVQSGVLIGVGEIDALTGALTSLFDSNEKRERLGVAARESVIATFSRENMVDNYRKLPHSA